MKLGKVFAYWCLLLVAGGLASEAGLGQDIPLLQHSNTPTV